MNQLVARVLGIVNNDIQVSGLPGQEFPESRWREAILFYLNGIWSGKDSVCYRPKLLFGDITLRLNPASGLYYAYGHAEKPQEVPPLGPDDLVVTSDRKEEVEIALARFVKNGRIKQLRLRLLRLECEERQPVTFVLWKKVRRGEYGCAGLGLPYAWSTKGPVWTRAEFSLLY